MAVNTLAVFNSNDIYPISADSTMPFQQHRDIFYIDNNINLGLNVLAEGIKSPHAWLTSLNGEQITTGLTSSKNIKILKI